MSTTHERLSFSEFLARVKRVARLFGGLARDGSIECEWATGFVVSEDQEVVGVGDARWWEAILPYRRQRVPSRRGEAGLDDEDEEDDE